jgi:formylglycine-generating enzyme required for sulfatase activity
MEAYARWAGLELPRRNVWLAAAYWNYEARRERTYPWGDRWPAGAKDPVWADERDMPTPLDDASLIGFAAGATPSGLYHMLGNVAEVVVDDRTGQHVCVGGGYQFPLDLFRRAGPGTSRSQEASQRRLRDYLRGEPGRGKTLQPDDRLETVGFRCVLLAESEEP